MDLLYSVGQTSFKKKKKKDRGTKKYETPSNDMKICLCLSIQFSYSTNAAYPYG